MGRKWIGIEMGEHAASHCKPRLDKVIAGEQGGISKAVEWRGGGGYRFYRLGDPVFAADGSITEKIRFQTLAAHVWFSETGMPWAGDDGGPVLGEHKGVFYALLYNGILGDKSVSGGNVLTAPLLTLLREEAGGWSGPMVIYGDLLDHGETCCPNRIARLGQAGGHQGADRLQAPARQLRWQAVPGRR